MKGSGATWRTTRHRERYRWPVVGLLSMTVCLVTETATAKPPPVEAYAALPEVSLLQISPSGKRVAFRQTSGDQDVVAIVDLDRQAPITSIGIESVKPRQLRFVDEDTLLLVASDTLTRWAYRHKYEFGTAWLLDLETGRLDKLLSRSNGFRRLHVDLGSVIGKSGDGRTIYMPARVGGASGEPRMSLLELTPGQKRLRVVGHGKIYTTDWFVDHSGRPLVREDFDNRFNRYAIWAIQDTGDRLLYEEETDRPTLSIAGVTADYSALVVDGYNPDIDARSFYRLDIADGTASGPILGTRPGGVRQAIRDMNRVVYGVETHGFYPRYEFFDASLTTRLDNIQAAFPNSVVHLVSWSDDFERLVVHVSGDWTAGAFFLFSGSSSKPRMLARQRPAISREHVAETIVDKYTADDGLEIPALLTVRRELADKGRLPLIVLPHGGPEYYDTAAFDWIAQYFASRDYAVLQPQFRGSSGFGSAFRDAGHGEWGLGMQTDLDAGVRYLIDKGIADPERVCIVGASYGGYAALAAGAFTPDLYTCHVSINGVSDIRHMLDRARRGVGKYHWIVRYWAEWYGAGMDDKPELDKRSPVNHASEFSGSVLLVHGKDDTVVPFIQSARMHKALEKAGKNVELVQLDGEDHWLSRAETRLKLLQAVAAFVDQQL